MDLRELRNTIERAVILSPGPALDARFFPGSTTSETPRIGEDFSLEAIEKAHILQVLARHKKPEQAAQILGIDAATLWRKRKRWEQGE